MPLSVAFGYGAIGTSALFWFEITEFSNAFWIAHLLLIIGIFSGTIGALVAYKQTSCVAPYINPVVQVDPRYALDLGVDPLVHALVDNLEAMDEINRDHVIRTAALTMLIGRRLHLENDQLREAGLAALFHDIGMLVIPKELLTRAGPLTNNEYEIIQRHAVYGADMLAESPVLRGIAPIVRAHHERIDGSGYPFGLDGTRIPLIARIVSVCDAYDAMINTQRFRTTRSVEPAIETLERYAGLYWDRRIVEAVVRYARTHPPTEIPPILDVLGRIGCDCIPHEGETFMTDAA